MKKTKTNDKKMRLMALLVLPVILAVCVQPGPEQPSASPTPSGAAFSGTPDLGISDFGRGLPAKIIAGYQLSIEATLKNLAPLIDGRENELSLKNVKVEFYNFGPYITGCDDYAQSVGKLQPEETRDAKCVINVKATDGWPDRTRTSFDQTLKMKASFNYDLLASLDDIMVLSKSEFARQKLAQSSKTVSVKGPVGITITVDGQPIQEEKTFTVHLKLQATKTAGQDIVTTETAPQYNIQYVQLQVPFAVAALGNFDRQEPCAGQACLIKENAKLNADGTLNLDAQLQAPKLTSPQETYSAKALATGFTVFKMADLKIIGYAS